MSRAIFLSICFALVTVSGYAQESVRVGVIKYKTVEKVEQTYIPLFEYLAERSNSSLEFEIVPEEEMGFRLHEGELDLGVFTIFPYLGTKTDFPDLHVFGSHLVDGEGSYQGAILVKKDSPIQRVTDLKGKRVLFVKPTSTSGFYLPKGIMEEYDVQLEDVIYAYSGGHDASIDSLANDRADAISIDLAGFDKVSHEQSDFRILESFDIPYHAYVFSPMLEASRREELSRIMFNSRRDPRAKRLFANNPLNITEWVPRNEDYYNSLRRYLRLVRIKPHVLLRVNAKESAQKALTSSGDVLSLIDKDIRQSILATKRFDFRPNDLLHTVKIDIELYVVDAGKFHFQVTLDDQPGAKGDLTLSEMRALMPQIVTNDLLKQQVIEANLLQKENEWFATYGADDGFDLEQYRFELIREGSVARAISADEMEISSKNLHLPGFDGQQGDQLRIAFIEKEIAYDDGEQASQSHNIFSSDFWKQDYWDKLGIILGVLFGISSAVIGRFLALRRKRKFKNVLYKTNELVKDYVSDQLKFKSRLIEQKEEISRMFESGVISENQLIILNNRLGEVEGLGDKIYPHEVELTPEQQKELEQMIVDGRITEKEFSRIMLILRQG